MLEQILAMWNIENALEQVKRNKGAGGVDGMQTDELGAYMATHWQSIRTKLLEGTYEPSPVKKVEIPKPQGGKRMLGIPTVLDRLIQQAISQVLTQTYEKKFSEHSYGFRPNRNCKMAVEQAQRYLTEGKVWVVELDLEKFFDKVNHDRLMSVLSWTIEDKRVLKLIRSYLRSGIMEDGKISERTEGTPQGSPLSPLLSNIVLDELDKELEKRGHSYVRYADDCSIYVGSLPAAKRVSESIIGYIEGELLLKVNREKTRISRPEESTLLGFSFILENGIWEIRISEKSIGRITEKCKGITRRSNGLSENERIVELQSIIKGYINYVVIAKAKRVKADLKRIDERIRTRLRICLWKAWKKITARIKELLKLGVPQIKAQKWGKSSLGYCRIAQSPILKTTLTNATFNKRGYIGFLKTYEELTKAQPSLF